MRIFPLLALPIALLHCGSSNEDDVYIPSDAAADRSDGSSDGASNPDGSSNDSSANDSSNGGDSSFMDDAGNTCDPNDSTTCPMGKKCCSEPTHKMPPTIYECVTPTSGGTCPLLP